ncbi:MAG: alpha-amylase family glycosyl hydrolase [Clostridiales bacterium]|nr:alpha-amylase family glycosyl hydrolase [Clostridiales bacterium]
MGVMFQGFYWDCPKEENCENQWWTFTKSKLPVLARAGFTALWLPPVNKAAYWKSMGYDPYDYYDLGEFDQKGGVPTWFGTKDELLDLIKSAHSLGMQVYADLVFNHNSGADSQELNPIDKQLRWTKFSPKSGKFPRDWKCFHPNQYETWDEGQFEGMPDICHRSPFVYTELINYARWLLEEVGFDGFRYDMVKGYGGWMVRSIQELRALRGRTSFKPYAVGECWDSDRTIGEWLDETNAWSDNPVGAFDFPLRWRLRDLCDGYGFSLRTLAEHGVLVWSRPGQAVTFVENHDVVRDTPIINDKLLAYAFILTHEGYPCVFWQDYFNWNLAQPDNQNGIDALIKIHEQNAAGQTQVLFADDNLYIMQRTGIGGKPGLVFVLNNSGSWNGAEVQTRWNDMRLVPAAWYSRADQSMPQEKHTGGSGRVDLWAAPRGYAVYVPG